MEADVKFFEVMHDFDFFLDRRYGRWGADNSDNFVVKVGRATVDQVVLNMVEAAVDEVAVDKEGIV